MDPRELQLSRPDALVSYQQQKQQPDAVGPGISKILQEMERQRRDHHEGEEMKRRTRILYVLLGIVLLCVYFSLLKRHFFGTMQKVSQQEDIHGGSTTLRIGEVSVGMEASSRLPGTNDDNCNYPEETLKLVHEIPFSAIFEDTVEQEDRYHVSDIEVVDGTIYTVSDESWTISKFADDSRSLDPETKQMGNSGRAARPNDSGYQALFQDGGTLYGVRKSMLENGSHHVVIEELSVGEDRYQVRDVCRSELQFTEDSKGFESVLSFRDRQDELVILGLCSRCGKQMQGVLVAMKKDVNDSSCRWKTTRIIDIPAGFQHYSSVTLDERGRVAIASQQESVIWFGQLLGFEDGGGSGDVEALKFDPKQGTVLFFPKGDNCDTIYCHIEGIHWMNQEMILAVSDKATSRDDPQEFRCSEKDQSVHVFVLP